jgi:hypothetical protein
MDSVDEFMTHNRKLDVNPSYITSTSTGIESIQENTDPYLGSQVC